MRARVYLLVLLHIDSHVCVCVCLCVCVHNGKLERNWCVECPLTLLPEAAASWCRDTACAVRECACAARVVWKEQDIERHIVRTPHTPECNVLNR
jgi:hypothetical protein